MNTAYDEYKRAFVMQWSRKIAARAGCARGKGGRGKGIRLREQQLLGEINVEARTWERYETGAMLPRPGNMRRIHEWARQRGYLGHPSIGGILARIRDAAPMMFQDEFDYWQEQQQRETGISDTDFELAQHEAWLWSRERAARLTRQAAALLNEAARIQGAHTSA